MTKIEKEYITREEFELNVKVLLIGLGIVAIFAMTMAYQFSNNAVSNISKSQPQTYEKCLEHQEYWVANLSSMEVPPQQPSKMLNVVFFKELQVGSNISETYLGKTWVVESMVVITDNFTCTKSVPCYSATIYTNGTAQESEICSPKEVK